MATQHGFTQETAPAALGSSANARLLVDIDLSVLGSPAGRFERAGHLGTSIAYQAALHLVFNGLVQPSGCTKSLLQATRSEVDGGASLAGSLHTGRWPRL